MKQRVYVITSGNYSNYTIVAIVRGNATPALSTLYKRFKAEYGLTDKPKLPNSIVELAEYQKWFDQRHTVLSKAGHLSAVELFVAWLMTAHDFVKDEAQEFFVEA